MKKVWVFCFVILTLVSLVFLGAAEDEDTPIIGPGGINPEEEIVGPGGINPEEEIVGPGGTNPNTEIIDPVLHVYMYVETNGGHLNVRAWPGSDATIIGRLSFGEQVLVTGYSSDRTWARILYGSLSDGYVMARYLSEYEPEPTPYPYPTNTPYYPPYPTSTPYYPPYVPTAVPYPTVPPYYPETPFKELNQEFDSMNIVPDQQYRVSTYDEVPLYWAPNTEASVQRYCSEGELFIVLAYNRDWLQVRDEVYGYTGFLEQASTY